MESIEHYVQTFKDKFYAYLCRDDKVFVFAAYIASQSSIFFSETFRKQVENYSKRTGGFVIDLADLRDVDRSMYLFFLDCTYRFVRYLLLAIYITHFAALIQ